MAADQARSDKIWTGQLTTTFPRQQHLTVKGVNYLNVLSLCWITHNPELRLAPIRFDATTNVWI